MPATSGDDKKEPQLELPSLKLPRLGRRRSKPQPEPEVSAQAQAGTEPAVPVEPETDPLPRPLQVRDDHDEPTQELPARRASAVASAEPAPTAPAPAPPAPEAAPEATPVPQAGARRSRPAGGRLAVPSVGGPVAAALTGLVVGAGGAAATYAAMAACEAVRGVSTCGGGPGFLILVAIVVLMVLAGALLLRLLGVSGSLSTSFLAVGMVTVLAMLLLLDVIFSPWMFLVVPALSAAAYLLSHWVTTRFENEDVGRRDWR